jgi:predicted ABC-type ATPase
MAKTEKSKGRPASDEVQEQHPTVYVIAGPNGAGKTTFATEFLPDFVKCREFLNADLIAAGLSPFAPETQDVRAGRLLLTRIKELTAAKAMAVARVRARVRQGGHNVPESVVRRRYGAGLRNFFQYYWPIAHSVWLLDGSEFPPSVK